MPILTLSPAVTLSVLALLRKGEDAARDAFDGGPATVEASLTVNATIQRGADFPKKGATDWKRVAGLALAKLNRDSRIAVAEEYGKGRDCEIQPETDAILRECAGSKIQRGNLAVLGNVTLA